jgi:uncharacterized membrane protein YdbT with pleckstrin-like domain
MSYVGHILQPGENLRHLSRLHWVVYLPGLVLLLVAVVVIILVPQFSFSAVSAMMFVVGLIMVGYAWFKRWTTEIAVTDRRVIYKRGFISRYTIEMNMDKIESVDVDQSIFGRILDYGTITIRGTGTGIEPLHRIDSPIEFRNFVTAR